MMIAWLMPVLLIVAGLFIVLLIRRRGLNQMNTSFHRKLITVYLVLLLAALVVSEVMEAQNDTEFPEKVSSYDPAFDVTDTIKRGKPIPERLVAARRTHETDGTLSLPKFQRDAYILIERTEGENNIVEETVIRPELYAAFDSTGQTYYDFSDDLQIKLPIWEENSFHIPKQPHNEVIYTFYHDSNMLNQFSKEGKGLLNYSSSSVTGFLIVYLSVPESIELDISGHREGDHDDYIEFL